MNMRVELASRSSVRRVAPKAWTALVERAGQLKMMAWLVAGVVALLLLPGDSQRVRDAAGEAVALGHWYAREHVVLCLIPALFIAGGIGVFVRSSLVLRFLGPDSNKLLAYGVASVSGSILSVCSCTVLPLFAGIWRMGAGLGPAVAFLFSGPAINVLAIILTARVLGVEIGLARGLSAVAFSVVVGVLMALLFPVDRRHSISSAVHPSEDDGEPVWPGVTLLVAMMIILVFANWSSAETTGFYGLVAKFKWWLVSAGALMLGVLLRAAYEVDGRWLLGSALATVVAAVLTRQPEVAFVVATVGLCLSLLSAGEKALAWLDATWDFTRQIVPLLLVGVLVAGFLLGRPGHEALIPSSWVEQSVGGSSLWSNLFAAFAGAFMYFATLTEVPILQGLIGSGMGKGPALALLLAGPALSLPSMLALRQIFGTVKTLVYAMLVVLLATCAGLLFGTLF